MREKIKNLLLIYNSTCVQVKAAGWFILCNILQRGIQFIVTPVYTRLLTTEEYGEYSLFTTWVNIFSVFATLNMSGGVYYNGITKYGRNVRDYTLSLQILGNICTVIALLCVTVVYKPLSGILGLKYEYILLMFLVLFFQPAFLMWTSEQRLAFSYRAMVWVTLCYSIMIPVIGLVLTGFFDLGAAGVICGYAAANCIIGFFFYLRNFLGRKAAIVSYWRNVLSFSIPLIPHYLAHIVLGQSDRIMLNYYEGKSQAGIYTLAYQVGMVLTIIVCGINDSLTPWMYLKLKDKNYDNIKEMVFLLVLLYSAISVPLILLAPEIILLLGTDEYYQAIYVIPPVVISTLINVVYGMFGTVLFYYEKPKLVSAASFSGALLNVILNVLFIPHFGLCAAGYTTLVSAVLMMVLNGIFMYRCCRKNSLPKDLFGIRRLGILLGIMTVFLTVSVVLYRYTAARYIILVWIAAAVFLKRGMIAGLMKQFILLKK